MDEFDKLVNRFEARRHDLEKVPGEKTPEKEILKEVIKEEIDKAMVNMPEQPSSDFYTSPPSDTQATNIDNNQTDINPDSEIEQFLDELCDVAVSKGVVVSVTLARKSGNPYLIDALHDKLVGKLYQELVAQGKIKSMN
ncbi:MAG: hypothetical protein NTW73_00930 [Candidatus Parcubacteria bacterium]|nr:hypothetical protein [Candidatus Parcubacteria bacterium]